MFMSPKHHNKIFSILKAQFDVKHTSSITNPSLGWNLGAAWGWVLEGGSLPFINGVIFPIDGLIHGYSWGFVRPHFTPFMTGFLGFWDPPCRDLWF